MLHIKTGTDYNDNPRIDMQSESEVNFWSRAFSLAPHELREAVRLTAATAADIERYVKSRRHVQGSANRAIAAV